MHAQKKFDDNLSGTTSISVFMRGRTLYVSNVGDSRAIIVSFKVLDGPLHLLRSRLAELNRLPELL